MTCETCRHSFPVERIGYWRSFGGVDWSGTHVHCEKHRYKMQSGAELNPTATVISKNSKCVFDPPKWEERGERSERI